MRPVITTRVAGVQYGDCQAAISKLEIGDPLGLCREPENPKDPNTILVFRRTKDYDEEIGYLPSDLAARYAPFLDANDGFWPASVVAAGLEGQEDSLYGALIRFENPAFAEAEEAVPA